MAYRPNNSEESHLITVAQHRFCLTGGEWYRTSYAKPGDFKPANAIEAALLDRIFDFNN